MFGGDRSSAGDAWSPFFEAVSPESLDLLIVANATNRETANRAADALRRHGVGARLFIDETPATGHAFYEAMGAAEGPWLMQLTDDDTLDPKAFGQLLALLDSDAAATAGIVAYDVSEDGSEGTQITPFERMFPEAGRATEWCELGRYRYSALFTLNNSVFRTELLQIPDVKMPPGTDLADYVYTYLAIPYVKYVLYSGLDLRAPKQSGNGGRCDGAAAAGPSDLLRLTRILYDAYRLEDDVRDDDQRDYMYKYLSAVTSTCTLALMSENDDASLDRMERLGRWMRYVDRAMYRRVRRLSIRLVSQLPSERFGALRRQGIRVSRRFFSLKS